MKTTGLILFGALLLSACNAPVPSSPLGPAPAARSQQMAVPAKALKPLILVADFSGDAILGYPLTANGNVAPVLDIAGAKTGLGHADNIALDSGDRIYVSINGKHIGVFYATSNGNVRPAYGIGGKKTQIKFPIGVAVDSKGYVYVADCGNGNIKVFAPGAHGNVPPARVISLPTGCTIEEAIDSNDDLWLTTGDNIILEFSSYATGNNFMKQIEETEQSGGLGIRSLALDSKGNIYAGNLLAKDIRVFAPTASGPSTPIRTIAGRKTQLGAPTGLSLDATDALYVTICQYCHQGSGRDSVLVFA
ncbi:MAG: hypothetical protein JO263_00140, partial [Candidatus Eremiobacteraeota bacterium]|nr:hypothetical protein [Candidatus Eremiobacteraeota bacterium]